MAYNMSKEDEALIERYRQDYANATDQAGKDAAHQAAENVRAKYNFSGGMDGSQYIPLGNDAATTPSVNYGGSYSTGSSYGGGIWGNLFGSKNEKQDVIATPSYQAGSLADIDAKLDAMLNREAFSYDVETDPLYAQYKAQYNREGNRAMNDTLAAAATNAGGMNSYAITAAQQANDYYNAQLADKIPELYELAYSMYLDEIDMDRQDLGLQIDLDNLKYDRYRDALQDYYNGYGQQYDGYRNALSDYFWGGTLNSDKTEEGSGTGAGGAGNTGSGAHGGSDDRGDFESMWEGLINGDRPSGSSSSGDFDYDEILDGIINGDNGSPGGGFPDGGFPGGGDPDGGDPDGDDPDGGKPDGGNPGGGYDDAGLKDEEIRKMQEYFGLEVDGMWGPASAAALNGRTADEAWEYYQNLTHAKVGDVTLKDYMDMASNAQEADEAIMYVYETEGKGAAMSELTKLWKGGSITSVDYNRLFSKYQNM